MTNKERVYFKIQAEFICDLARQKYWEGQGYEIAKKFLFTCFTFEETEESNNLVKNILIGKKILAGLYPDEEIRYVQDDKYEEYRKRLRYIKFEDRIEEEKPIYDYGEFLKAFTNELPSYKFRYEDHTQDNSTSSFNLKEFFVNLKYENLKLVGICKNPEYKREERIGVLIEDQKDFTTFWYHLMDNNSYSRTIKAFLPEELIKGGV